VQSADGVVETLPYCTRSYSSGSKGHFMKIAQVAPLIESVPPRLYGGTERIVSYLTEELVSLATM